jgi:outer membrane protein TolC
MAIATAITTATLVTVWTSWRVLAQPLGKPAVENVQRQRLETAREGVKLAEQAYAQGTTDVTGLLEWQHRVTATELALAKTKEQRVAALQGEVERARNAEAQVSERAKAGLATPLDALTAKYERLGAEAALAEEQP